MDEDEDHSFSLQIVEEFFEQAEHTFNEMDELLYVAPAFPMEPRT